MDIISILNDKTISLIKSENKRLDNFVKEILKRNYPDYNLDDLNEIKRLIEIENIEIEIKEHFVDIGNSFRITTEIRLFSKKQLK